MSMIPPDVEQAPEAVPFGPSIPERNAGDAGKGHDRHGEKGRNALGHNHRKKVTGHNGKQVKPPYNREHEVGQ